MLYHPASFTIRTCPSWVSNHDGDVVWGCCYYPFQKHKEINWLVVCLPLWKIWKSVGIVIPNCMEKSSKCSKPPTSRTTVYIPWSLVCSYLSYFWRWCWPNSFNMVPKEGVLWWVPKHLPQKCDFTHFLMLLDICVISNGRKHGDFVAP